MKIFLILFVLLFSSSVFAEWTILMNDVTDSDGISQDIYYDKSKMEKENNYLTLWILLNFHKKINGEKSTVILKTIECGPTEYSTEKYKLWATRSFDQSMGKGEIVADSGSYYKNSPWQYVGPKNGTLIHIIINYICDTKR